MADAGDVKRMRAIISRVVDFDIEVRFMPGWEHRGATFTRVPIGLTDHHDASTRKSGEWGALGIIVAGRPALSRSTPGVSGPLSQFQVARCLDGVPKVALCAAGRANHAGLGGPRNLGGVYIPANAGNSVLYGVEKANDGVGEPYTAVAHYTTSGLFRAILEVIS